MTGGDGASDVPLSPFEDRFREVANDSAAWLKVGRNLLLSAELLWTQIGPPTDEFFRIIGAVKQEGRDRFTDLEYAAFQNFKVATATYQPAFRLLAGSALENLMKAVHVRRLTLTGATVLDADGTLIGVPKTHDLTLLAERIIGVSSLSAMDRLLLQRLTESILWSGRYPVGIRKADARTLRVATGTSGQDWPKTRAFADRVIALHDLMS